jgi:hypothetical protein
MGESRAGAQMFEGIAVPFCFLTLVQELLIFKPSRRLALSQLEWKTCSNQWRE